MFKRIKNAAITYVLIAFLLLFVILVVGYSSKELESILDIDRGDWMNLLGALFGAAIPLGITLALEFERNKETRNQAEHLTEKIIELFLRNEIILNLDNVLGGKDGVLYEMLKNDNFPEHYQMNYEFEKNEFNKIKYEIIKHDNDKVKSIIDLYLVLSQLEVKANIDRFTEEEREELKRIIIENIDAYCN